MAKSYVVVGTSLAGATAAITLRDGNADARVTLIGAEREPPYERPPLSKAYLRGEAPFEKALVRPSSFYADHGIETLFGARVTRIDPAAHRVELVDGVLGESVGQAIAELHRAHGLRTIFEDSVAAFEGTSRVARVVTKAGLRLDCDFVVVGIGIEPAVDMLRGSGIHIDNGIVVDEYCQTNISGIYAAGDVSNHYHPVFDRQIRVEHWQNALKQGAAAARHMLGGGVAYDEIHWFWSDQYDANLQYAGFHTKWDELVVRGRLDSGSFLACYVTDGRIDAAVGLNRAKDVRRAMPLIRARRPVNLAQLRDEGVDLRSLLPSPDATSTSDAGSKPLG
jgi:NADPH-dependent 2,4-dienoyl-CoA reductase/sulfur reductase-like enzyme